jgi:hypothetical protein
MSKSNKHWNKVALSTSPHLDERRLAEWRRTAVLERRTVLKLTPQPIRTTGFPEV